MKLTKETVKAAFALELDKQGNTLLDMEDFLADDLTKKASLDVGELLKGIAGVAGGAAMVGGGALGLGGYLGYKANDDSNDKIEKKHKEKQQYDEAIRDLQYAMKSRNSAF